MRINKHTPAAALVGIWTVLLSAFVITVLYVGREVLIPLALAVVITFLLSPLVARIERYIGRIAAVLIVVAMLFGIIGGTGWLLARQVIEWSGARRPTSLRHDAAEAILVGLWAVLQEGWLDHSPIPVR